MKTVQLLHKGSLITYKATPRAKKETCLGYLFHFEGHGFYDPTLGKVDVTAAEAKRHNELLSQAEIDGLKKCKVGQHGVFYYNKNIVTTWLGTKVSDIVVQQGKFVTFVVGQMTFRGTLNEQMLSFKRIE